MAYRIKPHSKRQAKRLGVEIKPSTVQGKKIDVFKNGKKIASIGQIGYADYPTYLESERDGIFPKGYAAKRRKFYKQRHESDRKVKGTPGFYADQILW